MMKSRKVFIVIIIIGAVFLILAGIGGVGVWGWNLFSGQAKQALNNNSVCSEHIGDIHQFKLDFLATGDAEGEDVFVFRVNGSKGSGVVTAEFDTVDGDVEEIRSGTLQLSSGKIYNLLSPDKEIIPGEQITKERALN